MSENNEINRSMQMQKMEALGKFAGGIAHDFNNILSIIEGYVCLSMKQLDEGTLKPEQLQKILKSTQKGAGLTRQLLSFGRQKVDAEEKANLTEVLRQGEVLLHPLLGETIRVFMTPLEDTGTLWINASQDQLTQVILNLALNARDAMPLGGALAILCKPCQQQHIPVDLRDKYPEENFVRLSVVDSGVGIRSDILPRIFEPFFTTKDVGKGTGLGLSVVYGIVDQLKGCIEVYSVPGEGTNFDIYLPLTSAPFEQDIFMPLDSSMEDLAGKTILVAEDEPELRDILTEMFIGMNMKVLSAGNGNHALVVQEDYSGKIDFLLTDVVMPEMDGAKLGEMFQSIRPDSNVVYMSGYPFMDDRREIHLPEDAHFINKPLQQDKIRQVLERALQRRRERLGG